MVGWPGGILGTKAPGLLQIVGHVARIEDDRAVKERKDDDEQKIDDVVEEAVGREPDVEPRRETLQSSLGIAGQTPRANDRLAATEPRKGLLRQE